MEFSVSPPICLCYKLVHDVTLTSVILSELFILKADLTHFISLYICNIYVFIYNYVRMNILNIYFLFYKGNEFFLFPLYLEKTADAINNITHGVSIITVSS